jgi:pyruvate dehydrogenase E2 component (dihydrolipoamide acetyltransferase)
LKDNPVKEPQTIKVPDIGDFKDVDVVEVLVAVGDMIAVNQSLITLESDKASLDVPSPLSGKVIEVTVAVGDKVSEGSPICVVVPTSDEASTEAADDNTAEAPKTVEAPLRPTEPLKAKAPLPDTKTPPPPEPSEAKPLASPHASPSIRRFARELGVELALVNPTGPSGRILKEDVERHVRRVMQTPASAVPAAGGIPLPKRPDVDFAKFGPIETVPLSRVQRIAAAKLLASWLQAPQVTQFDQADITDLMAFRNAQNETAAKGNVKLSLLPFIVKACEAALKRFPVFNASLDSSGEALVLKKYFHIGIAVDTPMGLMVPVLRNVDTKGVVQLAKELGELSTRVREGHARLDDFQGASFTISSLGGIGGTAFTPIVNVPEVAILGVSKARWTPVYQDGQFVPRLLLPLSLSYDHRVVDGAVAVRFTTFLTELLGDLRRMLL